MLCHAGVSATFSDVRKMLLLMYGERHAAELARMAARKDLKDGTAFKMMPFECASNGMHGTFQWSKIRNRLEMLRAGLVAEIEEWRKRGAEQTLMVAEKHDASVTSCVHFLRQQEERLKHESLNGASIAPLPLNACVWEVRERGGRISRTGRALERRGLLTPREPRARAKCPCATAGRPRLPAHLLPPPSTSSPPPHPPPSSSLVLTPSLVLGPCCTGHSLWPG